MFSKHHHPAADIYTIPENPARPAQRECLKVNATGKNVTILAQRSQFRTIFFVLVDDLASPIWRKHMWEMFYVINISQLRLQLDSRASCAITKPGGGC